MLHCAHRNPETPPGFTNEMLINDSVVHEFDIIRYLTGEEIKNVQVRRCRATRRAPSGQHDPQHVLIETEGGVLADVEIFVNAQFGYQVATQAVFETGILSWLFLLGLAGPTALYEHRDVLPAQPWFARLLPLFQECSSASFDCDGCQL